MNIDIEKIEWKTCLGEKGGIILLFFPTGVLLILVCECWCGWFHTPVSGYNFHAIAVYLHSTFTVPLIGGVFRIQSNICMGAFVLK